MATGGGKEPSEEEWRRLQQLRDHLFPCDWSGDQFKALIRDEVGRQLSPRVLAASGDLSRPQITFACIGNNRGGLFGRQHAIMFS